MLVTERMHALGDHAKSSRQPPVRERKRAKADERVVDSDVIDETILDTDATHESVASAIVGDVTPQISVHENGTDDAIAEIASKEDMAEIATAALVAAEIVPPVSAADESAIQTKAIQENDDLSAAKRAIIHEWQNWSALHSDELDDPNVAEYFFRHLETKKPQVLNFTSQDKLETVRSVVGYLR